MLCIIVCVTRDCSHVLSIWTRKTFCVSFGIHFLEIENKIPWFLRGKGVVIAIFISDGDYTSGGNGSPRLAAWRTPMGMVKFD